MSEKQADDIREVGYTHRTISTATLGNGLNLKIPTFRHCF
jgi:hypothetical protein